MSSRMFSRLAALMLACILAVPAFSVTKYWDGGGGLDNTWGNPLNWYPDGLPTATDDVLLDNTYVPGFYEVTTNDPSTKECASLTLFDGVELFVFGTAPHNITIYGCPSDDLVVLGGATLDCTGTSTSDRYIIFNDQGCTGLFAGNGYLDWNTPRPIKDEFPRFTGPFINFDASSNIYIDGTGGDVYDISGLQYGDLIIRTEVASQDFTIAAGGAQIWGNASFSLGCLVNFTGTEPMDIAANVTARGRGGAFQCPVRFSGTSVVNTGVAGAVLPSFNNWEVSPTATVTMSKDTTVPVSCKANVLGTLVMGGKLVVEGELDLANTVSGAGRVECLPGFTLGVGKLEGFSASAPLFSCSGGYSLPTITKMRYFGAAQHTGNLCPSSLENLTVDVNSSLQADAPLTVTFLLDLKKGKLTPGSNVILQPDTAVTWGPGHVDGDRTGFIQSPLSRAVDMSTSSANFAFPIGNSALRTWGMSVVTPSATTGTVTVSVSDTAHPQMAFGKPVVWTVTRSAELAGVHANVTLAYTDNDMPESQHLVVRRYHDGTYEEFPLAQLSLWPWGIVVNDATEIEGEWTLGSDMPSGGPDLAIGPAAIDFGTVYKGDSITPIQVTLYNAGDAPLNFTGSGIALSGPDASTFDLIGGTTTPISAGNFRNFWVGADSSSTGQKTANLVITTDDYDEPTTTIAVSLNVIHPQLTFSPQYGLYLGTYHVDHGSTTAQVTMTNTGETELQFVAPTIVENNTSGAITISSISEDPLAPGESRQFTVTFDPETTGTFQAVIDFYTNMEYWNQEFLISGTGDLPDISSVVSSVDYGNKVTTEGQTKARSIPITNSHYVALDITSIAVTGPDAADFVITNSPAISPLSGGTRYVHVAFDPSTPGPKVAALEIQSDDPDQPVFTIPLSGTGVLYRGTVVYGPYTGLGPGVSTIGTGGDYTSMSLAAQDITSYSLTGGDWTFLILEDLFERYPTAITQYHTNGNKIVFRPAPGTNPTVTYQPYNTYPQPISCFTVGYQTSGTIWGIPSPGYSSSTGYQLPTDSVVLDGCNTPGGTSRNLKIVSRFSSGLTYDAISFNSDSDECAVRNCDIMTTGSPGASGTSAIRVNGLATGAYAPEAPMTPPPSMPLIDSPVADNCVIENCAITANAGSYATGITAGNATSGMSAPGGGSCAGLVIRNNDIKAGLRGIWMNYTREATVSNNTIKLLDYSNAYGFRAGIAHEQYGPYENTTATINILGNRILGMGNLNSSSVYAYGILMASYRNGLTYNVFNNMIGMQMTDSGIPPQAWMGIARTATGATKVNIAHNSVHIPASNTSYPGIQPYNCSGIAVTQSSYWADINIFNNLVRVTQPGAAALFLNPTNLDYAASDGNCLFANNGAITGQHSNISICPSLAEWQTSTSLDAASIALDPTIEHPPAVGKWLPPNPTGIDLHFVGDPGTGFRTTPRAGVTTDIDNDVRSLAQPFIGADEVADSDADGVPDVVEDQIGGTGDGNNDGTSDSVQANVASIPSFVTGELFTIIAPAGTALQNVTVLEQPAPGDAPPGVTFPYGFLKFTLSGIAVGSTVDVQVIVPESRGISGYHKYGATAGNPTRHYHDFNFDGQTGTQVSGTLINLRLVDGGRGDDDLTPNGSVTDPGAPSAGSSAVIDWSAY